jgi:undecaprenyl-diphosphatase
MSSILEKFNLGGFRAINDLAGNLTWLDWFMVFSAKWLGYLLIVYVLWWLWKKRSDFKKNILLTIGSAVVARLIFVELIRYFIYSPRPFMILENVNQLFNHQMETSFPSGHASFFFALAVGSYFINKKTGIWLLVLAGLIGFARIFSGVHWPLDIVFGVFVGWAAAYLVHRFTPRQPVSPTA